MVLVTGVLVMLVMVVLADEVGFFVCLLFCPGDGRNCGGS